MAILITGGAGYIGSQTCIHFLEAGFELVVVDNLSNSSMESLNRVKKITGKNFVFIQTDIRDSQAIRSVFQDYGISAVVHFAGLKAVGESVEKPALYYDNNVTGSKTLFAVMAEFNVKTIVFSSSATVYGDPASVPAKEDFPLSATNPYGENKLMVENILREMHAADSTWRIAILRYFNPIGAHVSGMIGEDPNGIPNNLLPYVAQVAVGRLAKLRVFGHDYDTHDGTGVRDYIHVADLADGHVKALSYLTKSYLVKQETLLTINLGTGVGYSVLDVVKAFTKVSGKPVPYEFLPRRTGDVAINYADASRAALMLGWRASRSLEQMCADAWKWQSKNPNGFR
jgi:UDP-glucose 4-epimerase